MICALPTCESISNMDLPKNYVVDKGMLELRRVSVVTKRHYMNWLKGLWKMIDNNQDDMGVSKMVMSWAFPMKAMWNEKYDQIDKYLIFMYSL